MNFPFGEKDLYIDKVVFENFLIWLDLNQYKASAKYENIRMRITRFFQYNQSRHPEECTIVTMNRVARKIHDGIINIQATQEQFIFGFACNVLREYNRHKNKFIALSNDFEIPEDQDQDNNIENKRKECLKKCFDDSPADEVKLLGRYKQANKRQKLQIAKELKTSIESLRVKISRITKKITMCGEKCLQGLRMA